MIVRGLLSDFSGRSLTHELAHEVGIDVAAIATDEQWPGVWRQPISEHQWVSFRRRPVVNHRRLSGDERDDSPAERLQILMDGEHAALIHVCPRVNPAIQDDRDGGEVGKLCGDTSVELGPFTGDDVEELCLGSCHGELAPVFDGRRRATVH